MDSKEITTIVCFHDLLGFGDMLSVSGGNLNSAIGRIAHKRIDTLRETLGKVKNYFPQDATFFQINDSATVICDINYEINSMHIDPASIGSQTPSENTALKVLKFICGAANLHQATLNNDHENQLGPGGRTFIVIGKRWPITDYNDEIIDIPVLQTNLAFAEAYIADSMGSKIGFNRKIWENIYINDFTEFLIKTAKIAIPSEMVEHLNKLHPTTPFPENILTPDAPAIEIPIFHRNRKFFSILSHYAKDINAMINNSTNKK
ncbi:TPA: hypothetical protein JBI17_03405 [Legionella pneumophila]|nr:hypothetical protein [Legionella pneumophila]HAU2263907.1 hypothetical protein [Legionella pneumophila]